MVVGFAGDGTKGGTKDCADARFDVDLTAGVDAGGSSPTADLIARLCAVVRDALASGPPPLPPDLCDDLRLLAFAGNDATRALHATKQESERVGTTANLTTATRQGGDDGGS